MNIPVEIGQETLNYVAMGAALGATIVLARGLWYCLRYINFRPNLVVGSVGLVVLGVSMISGGCVAFRQAYPSAGLDSTIDKNSLSSEVEVAKLQIAAYESQYKAVVAQSAPLMADAVSRYHMRPWYLAMSCAGIAMTIAGVIGVIVVLNLYSHS